MYKRKILLGICGGIAAYKVAELARELTKLGGDIQSVITSSAKHFISPIVLKALTGNEVREDLFDSEAHLAMGHIELARWADVLLIAPASANFLAKMANGLADDLLSTLYLVTNAPVIVCPAMNQAMWHHPATQENCRKLKERGVIFIGPDEGIQACGEEGFGRLAPINSVMHALYMYKVQNLLKNHSVVITAGPTREAIDPVRYITNHSSGKMGYALAEACKMAGAKVTLITGASSLPLPIGMKVIKVNSAKEMQQAVFMSLSPDCIFISTSAVCDYRVEQPSLKKIKKNINSQLNLELIPNPDIIKDAQLLGKASFIVGFAAETNDVLENARKKLIGKNLDMVIANQVGEELGFNSDDNKVTILSKNNSIELPLMNKLSLAAEIVKIISESINKVSANLSLCEH